MTEITSRQSERTINPVTMTTNYSKAAAMEKQGEKDNKSSLINFNIRIPIYQNLCYISEELLTLQKYLNIHKVLTHFLL